MSDTTCFLCLPDSGLVYERSDDFFAMLGHGPLGEGYSLIATVDHVRSMLDVDRRLVPQLTAFTATVRARLGEHYGPVAMTEHGRVGACVAAATRRYQPHCLHAHRLLFPGLPEVATTGTGLGVHRFDDFATAHTCWTKTGPYLYSEAAQGSVVVVEAPARLPRQFFRSLVAVQRGEPELASWLEHPQLDVVDAARRRLGISS